MPFVNPYNFISLRPGRKQSLDSYTGGEKLTGKLACRLIAKTPVIIPDHEKMWIDENGFKTYPFMTAMKDGREQPMIPGSSIRGVVRSVFEAMTNSCMRTNDDYYFSSRTGSVKKAGLLEKTAAGWRLHRAIRYADKTGTLESNDYQSGDQVHFAGTPGTTPKTKYQHYVTSIRLDDQRTGYVLKMNRFEKGGTLSSYYGIFEQQNLIESRVDDIFIETFKENIRIYAQDKNAAHQPARIYQKRFEGLQEGELIPVWYEQDSQTKKYCFALSQLSRNVYTKKPKDFLDKDHLLPCGKRSALCDACALFGFVGDGKEADAMGSKVRFSDAWCKSGTPNLSYTKKPLPILSSPKSSSLEFYLRLSGAKFYTADNNDVTLAGRKFYWHHPNGFVPSKWPESKEPKQTSFMQSVETDADTTFCFDVYFDGISQEQLNQLYTALTFGENEGDQYCHKIGHGKPLGFGSAKITVVKAAVRCFEDGEYYEVDAKLTASVLPEEDELRMMAKRSAMQGKIIDYPRTESKGDIYEWFSGNRLLSGNENNRKYFQFLKPIPEKKQELPSNPKSE